MSDDGSMGTRRQDAGAYVFLGLMVLLGSSTATAAKLATRELPVELLPLVRFGLAGLCLLPAVWRPMVRMIRTDLGRLVAASALCVPVNQSFFLNGNKLAPTSHTGLIYASCPLVVLGLATWLGQERFRRDRLMGVVLSVLGVVVIGAGNLAARRGGAAGASAFWGDLLLVGAVVSWGGYLTVNKPLVARHGSLPTLAGTFLVGTLIYLPFAGWSLRDASLAASGWAWGSLIYLALVVSIVGLACQNLALKSLDASQVATVGNLAPLLTIVWGVVLLGESVTSTLAVGGALTLTGALWAGRPAGARAVPGPLRPELGLDRAA